jgi:hypothetical protein
MRQKRLLGVEDDDSTRDALVLLLHGPATK